MQQITVHLATSEREQLVDVTSQLEEIAQAHPTTQLMTVFARGATAAIMIQENWDVHIQADILECLGRIAPRGQWRHDAVDGNADAHIKAGIVGPSETIPVRDGSLLLGQWQNVFFCDFDGPRSQREMIVTLLP